MLGRVELAVRHDFEKGFICLIAALHETICNNFEGTAVAIWGAVLPDSRNKAGYPSNGRIIGGVRRVQR
ncbi:hypothetical protein D3C81_1933850 [compost metagenome]